MLVAMRPLLLVLMLHCQHHRKIVAVEVPSARILARTQVLRAAKYGCPDYHPPPPPRHPHGPCKSCVRMMPCNATETRQRWSHASDGAISPTSSAQQCLTRGAPGAPLSLSVCRGHAGSLDPLQQWSFNLSAEKIVY
eukprot:COSAG02_NODE_27135_length_616_cov_1.058027_1_plen_136_part_10